MENNAELPMAPVGGGINAQDIVYVLFRHKWKIIISSLLGFLTAGMLFLVHPPPYQSDAMLFIRYVMENSNPGLPDSGERTMSPDTGGDTIMATEEEILSSLDIAVQVADAIGPDKFLPNVKDAKLRTRDAAANVIRRNLGIYPIPGSSVIHLVYKSTDPTLVQPVLTAVVDTYKKKHIEVHRGGGIVGDFLSQETDQFRSRLAQTEDELRKAKAKAGIVSVQAAEQIWSNESDQIQRDIVSTRAQLAERMAVYDALKARVRPGTDDRSAAAVQAPPLQRVPEEAANSYRQVIGRLDWLRRSEDAMASQFTDQNVRLKEVRAQIVTAESAKHSLETKYPQLIETQAYLRPTGAPRPSLSGDGFDLTVESARLEGLRMKISYLTTELKQIKSQEFNVDQQAGTISELERQRSLDETNYRYYSTHLEASRIDEALGAGRALNIAEIQNPTPPMIDWAKMRKIMLQIAAGGIGLGIAWAFVIEFYVDHTLRRPADIERKLGLPLFLSMPLFKGEPTNPVFHETLRDRLIAFFESKGLTHKPKLVAVTGVGRHSGVTSTASGLARSLSEIHDGNVLLVDMTMSQGSAQQFNRGKAVCGFDELLESRESAQVQQNLYVVGDEPNDDRLSRALPTRFQRLVPQLKASDFDYIIFDMPPVNQISITPRLAQFMDMVLLVVESEKTDRDLAKQAAAMLEQSRAYVGTVLNKSRNYVPSRAHHDFLGTT